MTKEAAKKNEPKQADKEKETRRGHGEGTLKQMPDKTWRFQISLGFDADGKRVRPAFYGRTKGECKEQAKKALEEWEKGCYQPPSKQMTVSEWLDEWLTTYAKNNVRQITWDNYKRMVDAHLKTSVGQHKLKELQVHHVQKMLNDKLESGRLRVKKDNPNKGLSPRMVEYIWTVLHAALKQAVQNGLVSRNVADGVKKPQKIKQEFNLWTVEEANRFLYMLKESDYRMFVLVLTAFGTGGRRSELLGLRWTDLDLKAGTMDIKQVLVPAKGDPGYAITPPKTKKSARTVALPEAVKKELEAWRKEQQKEKRWTGVDPDSYNPLGLVFTNEIGQPYSPHTVTHSFTRYRKASGLPPMRLHDMRHLHATTLLRMGADIKTIQEQLGHSTISTTGDFYLHVLDETKRESARMLDDALLR